jgi:putative ABC transport system permease protein
VLRATLKSLLARKLRLFMSGFAIILGVAFVAGSLIFTDTLGKTFESIMDGSTGEVVVRPEGVSNDDGVQSTKVLPASVVDDLSGLPDVSRVDGNVSDFGTFVVGTDGKLVGGSGAPGIGINYNDAPAMTGETAARIVSGRPPERSGEVVVDTGTAERAGYEVGDTVQLVTSTDQPSLTATLVGTMEFGGGSMAGASLVGFDTATAQDLYLDGRDVYNDVWVTGQAGVSQSQLRDEVASHLPSGVEAVTGDQAAEEAANDINQALSFITTFLLVFAGIALFVGSFLIINTFSILVAQRSRELALLRAIGAKRGQVTRSVIVEAFLVGFIGATVGLGLGAVLAVGIKVLFGTIGLDLSDSGLVFEPRTVVAAYAVGIVVTVVAAYLPARRAGKIAPVAALRDDPSLDEGPLHWRVGLGALLILVGAAALGTGLFADVPNAIWYVGGGIFGVVLGAALTSPLVGRPVIALAGVVYRRLFGTVGRMAEQNAIRNPRRTAATASALMIGLTLVSMMAVVGQSTKASIDQLIEENFTADYVVSNAIGMPFSPAIAGEVADVPGVDSVSPLRMARVDVGGDGTSVAAVDTATFGRIAQMDFTDGDLSDLDARSVLVRDDTRHGRGVGDTVDVTFSGDTTSLRIAGFYHDTPALAGAPYLLSLRGMRDLGVKPADTMVYLTTSPSASSGAVQSDIDGIIADLPTVTLKDQAAFAEEQRAPIDQLLYMIYALLGLALVIAVLGIVNTLALSVMERTREIGLLRAVGLGRRQLKRMIRLEAMVIAILGAVLGVVLGVGFGVALQQALADDGIEVLAIPYLYLTAFLVVAAAVGVLAALWPARRAARLDVLQAIATE